MAGARSCWLVIRLGETSLFTTQVGRHVWCQSRHEVVLRQIVIDLGVGGPVPGGSVSLLIYAQCRRSLRVFAKKMAGEVNEQLAQLLDTQRLDYGRIGVDVPGVVHGDSTAFRLSDDSRSKEGASQIWQLRSGP